MSFMTCKLYFQKVTKNVSCLIRYAKGNVKEAFGMKDAQAGDKPLRPVGIHDSYKLNLKSGDDHENES